MTIEELKGCTNEELMDLKSRLIIENNNPSSTQSKIVPSEPNRDDISIINEIFEERIKIFENTCATGGPSLGGGSSTGGGGNAYVTAGVGGMGNVVSSQPSLLAGSTLGTNYSGYGGTVGSGDISTPYNASGGMYMNNKIRTGLPDRKRKGKKNTISKGRRSKIMKFDEFNVNKVNRISDYGIKGQFGNTFEKNYYNIERSVSAGKPLDQREKTKILRKLKEKLKIVGDFKIGRNSEGEVSNFIKSDDIKVTIDNNKFMVNCENYPSEYFGLNKLGDLVNYIKGYHNS